MAKLKAEVMVEQVSRFCFITLVSFFILGSIKVYMGTSISWFTQLVLLLAVTISSMMAYSLPIKQMIRERLSCLYQFRVMIFGWMLFMLGIAIAAAMNNGIDMYVLIKYTAFIFLFICLLLAPVISPQLMEKTLIIALVISLVPLIIFGLLRQTNAMVIFADGRMGWLASWPGTLWKSGALVWPYAVWRCLKKPHYLNILLAFCSVLIMALDGSRTAMLWLILVWVLVSLVAIFTRVQTKPILTQTSLLLIVTGSFFLIQPIFLGWILNNHIVTTPAKRVVALNNTSASNSIPVGKITATRLLKGDNTRLLMWHTGWEQAIEKFPWGGGFESTKADEHGTDVVIHQTYLQLLADEGILSFVGYLMFLLTPFYYGLKFVFTKYDLIAERFELMLCALSIIALFLFIGFFHPLSNELTEWGVVLVSITIIIRNILCYNK